MTTPRVEVDLPDLPWVPVPADVEDPEGWAQEQVEALGAEPGGPSAQALAAELAVVARHAATARALACAVLLTDAVADADDADDDDEDPVPADAGPRLLAVLLVDQVDGADTDALRLELATATAADVAPPEVTLVTLPVGAAVRARTVTAPPEGAVLESVDHVVALGDGTALRAQLSWLALGLGEPLQELADEVARGLRLVR